MQLYRRASPIDSHVKKNKKHTCIQLKKGILMYTSLTGDKLDSLWHLSGKWDPMGMFVVSAGNQLDVANPKLILLNV